MLARNVRASVLGTLLENKLYSGYANGSGLRNISAYIISEKTVKDEIEGIIIGVITINKTQKKVIVAPKGEVYYEPEIRKLLSKVNNVNITSLNCLYEKSCGAVIFYKDKKDVKVLLVKNNNSRFWSFPKGHIEPYETEEETAIREVKEETNLDIEILNNFREISKYSPFGKIRKKVVFFLAQTFNNKVTLQKSELDDYIWVTIKEALNKSKYDNDIEILNKAENYIKEYFKE